MQYSIAYNFNKIDLNYGIEMNNEYIYNYIFINTLSTLFNEAVKEMNKILLPYYVRMLYLQQVSL